MPELTGKLDTSVNGPEGLLSFDGDAWDHVDWRHQEEQVRRLRGRIFKAVQDGDWPAARNLHYGDKGVMPMMHVRAGYARAFMLA